MLGRVEIQYGPSAKKLVTQLTDQGININDYALVTMVQKHIDAANVLFITGYLTELQYNAINNKIHKHIINNLQARSEP